MAAPARVLSADWVVPVDADPIPQGAVAIGDDGLIAAVGPAEELGAGEQHPDAVILPGFVNAHTHLEYAVYAGFGDGLSFAPWIATHVERKRRLDLESMEAIARVGAAACLQSGTTMVGDASFAGAAAAACAELGLPAVVYLEVFGGPEALAEIFEPQRERLDGRLPDWVTLGISPHAPYTCTIDLYEACSDLGVPVTTHLAESEDELTYLATGGGPWDAFSDLLVAPLGQRPIRALAGAGVLRPGLVAAHCVHVDDEEIALLAEHRVAVAHCPRSNGILGCGVAPVAALLDAGVPVCIATDSPASAPSFDMFEELRAAIVAARAREQRPGALTAHAALELATLGGARALGVDRVTGSLAVGKRADLTVLSLEGSPFSPAEDPVVATVLGGSPGRVTATLVGGEDRYRRGETDWRELTSAARRARSRMLR